MKILVDQMYQNIYLALKKLGYDVVSVDNLIAERKPIKSDYSIIKHAENNKMVLITRDGQNRRGCEENGILCISLGENPDINAVVAELEMIRAQYDKKQATRFRSRSLSRISITSVWDSRRKMTHSSELLKLY